MVPLPRCVSTSLASLKCCARTGAQWALRAIQAPDAWELGSDRTHTSRVSWRVKATLYAAEVEADVANLSIAVAWLKSNPEPFGTDVPLSVAIRAATFAEQQGTLLVARRGTQRV